ncbi:MAG: DNA polymerase III epsilon subunit-like protein [Salibacteraceae bacterium]|jgi:DNA polymerase III epsilon subunit-like protein
MKIHGITDEKCQQEGVELEEALSALDVAASKVDDIVGHNITFDYKVLHAYYLKEGVPFSLSKKNKIDTMRLTGKHLGHKPGFRISLYNSAEKVLGNSTEWNELKEKISMHSADGDVFVTAILYHILKA